MYKEGVFVCLIFIASKMGQEWNEEWLANGYQVRVR
jgi:hypothetical protein